MAPHEAQVRAGEAILKHYGRFDSQISPPAGHQLRGRLATTPAGLSPASPSQLGRTHTAC